MAYGEFASCSFCKGFCFRTREPERYISAEEGEYIFCSPSCKEKWKAEIFGRRSESKEFNHEHESPS